MKTKFIYVVLMALFLGSQMTLSAQNKENKERKQHPTPEQMMQMQTNQMVRVMTDAEIAKMLKDQFAQSRKMLDIREKYYNEFSKILSQKQIMKIYQQEKSNMNKFRKEFDRRKGQKPGQGHKPGQDRQRQRQHTPHQTQK